MAKAGAMRACAYTPCAIQFTPRDVRQLYHDPECKQLAMIERRDRFCLNCKHVDAVATHGRFCSAPCEQAYREHKKPGRKPRSFVPVIVLLPAGCNPTRSVALPVAPESTERLGGGQTYGEVSRRVWCARYERCLSHAVSKNWQGFNCDKCDIDEPDIQAPRPKHTNWEW